MPVKWEDAVAVYSKDSLLKFGYVPYHIIMMKEKLTHAFRDQNKDSILFYAADMAHYIGDACVPLHTSINYDGQLTKQKGLHALWESMIPELEINQYDLSSRHHASYLEKPDETIWQTIRRAHVLLNDVFRQEKEASALFPDSTKYKIQLGGEKEVKNYTNEFAKEYSKRLGN